MQSTNDNEEEAPPKLTLLGASAPRHSPYMGLMEAIGWIATRDRRLSDGTHRYQYERSQDESASLLGRSSYGDAAFETWQALFDELWNFYGADLREAEQSLFAAAADGRLDGFGRFRMNEYELIPAPNWIETQLRFEEPDSIEAVGKSEGVLSLSSRGAIWAHVRFKRGAVLDLWPEAEAPEPTSAQQTPSKPERKFKGTPGPDLDLDWRDKVFAYCKTLGKTAVANPKLGQREFLRFVKEYYNLKHEDEPKDPRRTNSWRERWLDEAAGLKPKE